MFTPLTYDPNSYNAQLARIQSQIATMQQPYQPAPPVQIPQIQHVSGIDGAKAFQKDIPASASIILMDSNEDKFYMVSKDANGNMNPVVTGRFTLEQEQNDVYVTKKDFEEFKTELKKLLKGANNEQPA